MIPDNDITPTPEIPADRYINWREVPDPDGGKPRKVPTEPATGNNSNPHDPSTWMTRDAAYATGFNVGVVLTENDPYFLIDLDDCRDPDTGIWHPGAVTIAGMFPGAAVEVSVNGTGMHIMGRCDAAALGGRKHKFSAHGVLCEFYHQGRFVALGAGLTGDMEIDWTPTIAAFVPGREVLSLVELTAGPVPEYTGPADDVELIKMMLAARGSVAAIFGDKASIADLWNRSVEILARLYPSPSGKPFDASSADAALMLHLAFWTGKDAARMDKLFRLSGLMRDKYADRPDYRTSTISGCVALCKRVYDKPRPTVAVAGNAPVSEGPQPLIREIPKGEPYPVEALGPLMQAVQGVQDKTQAPIAIAAQSALSVASLAVQGFADVETLGGSAPCSLFCLTIAQSGERKSSCDKLLMQAVREYEADAAQQYKIDLASHTTELKIWDTKHSKLARDVANPAKANDAEAKLKAMPPQPEPPLSPNRTATDPTFEGMVKFYVISHPSLGLFTDEAGSFIGGHAMNRDNRLKTCAGLSGLWDGSPINRTRAGDGATTLRGRRLASHMMIQPIAARPLLADPVASGQGFLARFLICEPESAIGFRIKHGHSSASDAAISAFGSRLRQLLDTEPPLREDTRNELEPRLLGLSVGAKELLQEYYDETERAQAPNGEFAHVRSYGSKTAEQAARIAGVITLWLNHMATEVAPDTMAKAISLARFYLSEARRLADAAVISEEFEQAECLKKWLHENCSDEIILPSDIVRNGPSSLRDSKKVKDAIEMLEAHRWLIALPPGTMVRDRQRKASYQIMRP